MIFGDADMRFCAHHGERTPIRRGPERPSQIKDRPHHQKSVLQAVHRKGQGVAAFLLPPMQADERRGRHDLDGRVFVIEQRRNAPDARSRVLLGQ